MKHPAPLITAISPYHLATREPAAMAGLVLGTRAVTLLPHPSTGASRESVARAVHKAPRYLRLMESWRWSTALWRAGVIASSAGGEEAAEAVAGVYGDIRNEASLSDLKPLTRSADALADERPDAFLDALSADLLKGGPDPGFNIPLNAALERFSQRHGLVVVRGSASSVVQRAETRLGTRVFSIGIPMLASAGGERLLRARRDLEGVMRPLRAAIAASFEAGAAVSGLGPATLAYAEEFRAWADSGLGEGDDETGKRVRAGYMGILGMVMPGDAVLRSSRVAVRSVGGYSSRAGGRAETATDPGVQWTIVVREMNVAPEHGGDAGGPE